MDCRRSSLRKRKRAFITQRVQRELRVADKLDARKHRILLVMQNDIGADLASWVRSQLGALVGNVAVENDRITGHWVQMCQLLLVTPTLERIVSIFRIAQEWDQLLRHGPVQAVLDESQARPVRRIVGQIECRINTEAKRWILRFGFLCLVVVV